MITYKQINWRRNTQIIRDRIYELEHLVTDKPLQLIFRHTIKIKHLKLQPIIKQGVPYHGTHESPES